MGIPEASESPNLLTVVSVEKSLHQILPPVSSWPFQLPAPEPTPAKTLQSSLYLNLQLLLYEILQNGTIDFVCVCVEGVQNWGNIVFYFKFPICLSFLLHFHEMLKATNALLIWLSTPFKTIWNNHSFDKCFLNKLQLFHHLSIG